MLEYVHTYRCIHGEISFQVLNYASKSLRLFCLLCFMKQNKIKFISPWEGKYLKFKVIFFFMFLGIFHLIIFIVGSLEIGEKIYK